MCVLQIDFFQFALGVNYMAAGMTEEESTAHMDATRRKVFLITAAACVLAMTLGGCFRDRE